MEHKKIEQAIHFATDCHSGQLRKGSDTPYIMHPLEVMQILHQMGADTDLIVAGLLHDVVEDTDTGAEEIENVFGADVASLVAHHSEDKSRTWQERKETAIREAANADERLQKLILADKLSNIRSMKRDFDAIGDKLWERFNAGKEKQAWYYKNMVKALQKLGEKAESRKFFEEFKKICEDVFE